MNIDSKCANPQQDKQMEMYWYTPLFVPSIQEAEANRFL